MKILAIESSCDDTSAAVLESRGASLRLLSSEISSQIAIHEQYGGIVPEVAARHHIENIIPVIKLGLKKAKIKLSQIDAVAVTAGPGLMSSLLVGVNTARALAYTMDVPLIPVNHHEGHIYANWLEQKNIAFPVLCLIVSGGHTKLVLMKKHFNYTIIGRTRDDAAGEAFDKIAKMIGLGFPGGPAISKQAQEGKAGTYKFPRPMINEDNFDFSFAGLKTHVLYEVRGNPSTLKLRSASSELKRGERDRLNKKITGGGKLTKQQVNDISRETEQAIVDVLIAKTLRAVKENKIKTVMLAGGVSANQLLRDTFSKTFKESLPKVRVLLPPRFMTTDNAAMIAVAAYYRLKLFGAKKYKNTRETVEANPVLELHK